MVQTRSGKLYTGISTDVDRRFEQHKSMAEIEQGHTSKKPRKGAKFFYSDPAVEVVYRECCDNRSSACKREAEIKKLSRKDKCLLAGIVTEWQ